mmetsp:Transcript_14899/g.24256  ORF Transcript_14899/g.24256 Transcript_14899/m.24256 type:complete len:315 (+) Transcript_14899:182-1126(+)
MTSMKTRTTATLMTVAIIINMPTSTTSSSSMVRISSYANTRSRPLFLPRSPSQSLAIKAASNHIVENKHKGGSSPSSPSLSSLLSSLKHDGISQPNGLKGWRRRELVGTVQKTVATALIIGLLTNPAASTAKVVYGEDITLPNLDRDFGPDETVQADLAWQEFRAKKKSGLATAPPSKASLSPSRYLAIIYTLKDQSFDDLKNFFRRAVLKDTVSQMQAEFRRMDVSLVQDGFDEMRQSMYYLPYAVAQKNSALGYNLQRRYNVVEDALEILDRDINFLSYGRSDITNDDLTALKQSLSVLFIHNDKTAQKHLR